MIVGEAGLNGVGVAIGEEVGIGVGALREIAIFSQILNDSG